MGDGETWGTLPIIIAIIGLVLLQYFFSRRRRSQTVPRDVSRNLLSEVMLNQALAGRRGIAGATTWPPMPWRQLAFRFGSDSFSTN